MSTVVDYAPDTTISLEGGLALLEEGLGVLYFKNLKTGKIIANIVERKGMFSLAEDGTYKCCAKCEHCGKITGLKQ